MKKFTDEMLTSLGISIRAYYDYQYERIAMDNRLGQKKDGTIKKKAPMRDLAMLVYLQDRRNEISNAEKIMEKEITLLIQDHPLWTGFLRDTVKGCGPVMAAVIISQFDIYKAPAASNLISFAGLAPGKDKKTKGQKCKYNQFLKSKLCGVLGSLFLQCKSVPYTGYYYNRKMRTENSNEKVWEISKKGEKAKLIAWKDATKSHRHNDAIRIMIKMFLIDLYVAWREIEGLPVRKPYAEEYLGREHNRKAA